MESVCTPDLCTGCAACMNVCSRGAISMQECPPFGHLHPVIDASKCIDCGLCAKTCPANHEPDLKTPQKAFAAICRDSKELMSSSSGGASAAMATTILRQGGVVYGCVQKNYNDIAHRRISSMDELWNLKGSKYVQSNINLIYREVKEDLKQGVPVLFTGTPCQIAGLKRYLRKDYENLYLVDLVCHGVPSQRLLRENVESMVKIEDGKPLPYVNFRKKGEPVHRMYGVFLRDCSWVEEKKQLFLHNNYITAFMQALTCRESCYTCRYAQGKRGSDITISDYWGLGKSEVPSENGVSLLLQNTEKGGRLIDAIRPLCVMEERSVEEAIRGNGQLMAPSECPSNRKAFIRDYEARGEAAYAPHLKAYKKRYIRQQALTFPYKMLNLLKRIILAIPGVRQLYHLIKRVK